MSISPDYRDPVTGSGEPKASSMMASKREYKSTLDKDAFLQLLVTQMRYQDPLSPTSNEQFIGQMAQFSALEQMNNLYQSQSQSQAYGLIGKNIDATIFNSATGETEAVSGVVTSTVLNAGKTYVLVNDKLVELGRITNVHDSYMNNIIASDITQQQSMLLIGKHVQAIITHADGTKEFVEGKVEYMKTGANPMLVVGNKEVFPQEVLTVSGENLIIGKEVTVKFGDEIVEGKIDRVDLGDKTAFVIIGGKRMEVNYINDVTDAIRYIDEEIEGFGVVDSIAIKDKEVYVVSGDKQKLIQDVGDKKTESKPEEEKEEE